MGLLQPAENHTAVVKVGFMGFQGGGKTYTAHLFAKGLMDYLEIKNPKGAFFDTEKGLDWVVESFKTDGIEMFECKSRSFMDLVAFMKEVKEAGLDFVIIDSITHVWNELQDSYIKRLKRKNGLLFQDWGILKREWRQFTDQFIGMPYHCFVCGRAGYEYDMEKNDSGKRELIKTGTKMKAEGEFGFESDLLVEMEAVQVEEGGDINRAYVRKDRSNTINGQVFDDPEFKNFLPFVEKLNLKTEHKGIDTSRNSEGMFGDPDYSYTEFKKQKDIALEELDGTLTICGLTGTSQKAKEERANMLEAVFGTFSKTKIEQLSPEEIHQGRLDILKRCGKIRTGENQPVVKDGEAVETQEVTKDAANG